MADFETAYGETEIHEGGYVNDPVDPGGETHRGISRRFHPDWAGWDVIDRYKTDFPSTFAKLINDDQRLVDWSKDLYRRRYWTPILGDQLSDQQMANKVFDTAVNQGVATSIRYLQEGLNLLNRNQRDYADVEVDGRMGKATLAASQQFLALEQGRPDYLLKILNLLQAMKYIQIMRSDPSQRKFARGWLNRVDLR